MQSTPERPDGDEELLDTGAPRRRPVPTWALAVLLVLAVLVALVVQHRSGGGTTSATPSTPAPTPSQRAPLPVAVLPNSEFDDVYDLIGDPVRRRLFAVSSSRLVRLDLDGAQVGGSVPVRVGGNAGSGEQLVLDPVHEVVWVVPEGATAGSPGVVEEVDGDTLQVLGRFVLPGPVESAAVLDGSLYLAGGGRLLRLDLTRHRFPVVRAIGSAPVSIVADPRRHRILYVEQGRHLRVGAVASGRLTVTATLPLTFGTLQVVGTTIWAGGGRGPRAGLVRLDPGTLRAGPDLAARTGFRGPLQLVGGGARSLYVRGATATGSQIRCVGGRDARVRHRFGPIGGVFVTVGHRGFDGSAPALHQVPMGGCPG